MIKLFITILDSNKVGNSAVKAIVFSGILSTIIKVVGFFKESVIAYYFGISEYVDFYVLALIYASFFVQPIGGALATLLTQKYIEISKRISGSASANIYLKCQIFGMGCMIMVIISQIFLLQLDFFKNIIENKFNKIEITYIYFLLPIGLISFMTLVNGSVLTAQKQFKTYTILKVLVPISILIFLITFPSKYKFEALLIGTLFGFFLELCASKLSLKEVLTKIDCSIIKKRSIGFNKIIKSMPSMVFSGIVMSGCLIVDQLMASLAGEGAVSEVNFGNRLPLALISIIAIVWSVLYPNFIGYTTSNDYASLKKSIRNFKILIVLFLIPLCGVLAFFSQEIASILFERGAFVKKNTIIVANIQMLYLIHIPLYVLSMVCIRVINALENTQIILIGNILLLIINITLNLYFIDKYGVVGIPLATLVSYSLMTLFWMLTSNLLINSRGNN